MSFNLLVMRARLWPVATTFALMTGCTAITHDPEQDPSESSGTQACDAWQCVASESRSDAAPNARDAHAVEFADLVSNTVRWAQTTLTVLAARTLPAGDAASPGISDTTAGVDPAQALVELKLELALRASPPPLYVNHRAWMLELADGTTLMPLPSETRHITVLTDEPQDIILRYQATADVDLHGAWLVVNGADPDSYEPERIPLDRAYETTLPRRVESLLELELPDSADGTSFSIADALYDVNSTRTGRAARDQRILLLRVVSADPIAFETAESLCDQLTLRVDGAAIHPAVPSSALRAPTTSMDVEFEFDASQTNVVLEFAGADSIPIDLASSTQISDES